MGCKDQGQLPPPTPTPDSELITLITKEVDRLYAVYERFDYDWIEFYVNNYTAISRCTDKAYDQRCPADKVYKIYAKYEVKLLDRGRPTVISSEDMAISYNTFYEIFINKETRDTIKNIGTYMITWKRQSDESWKIVFETLQNHK